VVIQVSKEIIVEKTGENMQSEVSFPSLATAAASSCNSATPGGTRIVEYLGTGATTPLEDTSDTGDAVLPRPPAPLPPAPLDGGSGNTGIVGSRAGGGLNIPCISGSLSCAFFFFFFLMRRKIPMIAARRTVPPMEAPAMTAGLGLLLPVPPPVLGWGVWVPVSADCGTTTRVVTTGTSTKVVLPSVTTAEVLIEVSTVVFGEADLLEALVPPVTIVEGGWVMTVPSRVMTVPARVVVLGALLRVCEMVCTKLEVSRLGAEGVGAEGDWVLMTVLGEGGVLPSVTALLGPVVVTAGDLAVVEGGRAVVEGGLTVSESGLTVSEGGLVVSEGGLLVTEGGLTVSAGGLVVSGGLVGSAGGLVSGGLVGSAGGLVVTAGGAVVDGLMGVLGVLVMG